MDHFDGHESHFDDDADGTSFETATEDDYSADDGYHRAEGGFTVDVTDAQAVDVDGDGVADGVVTVSYSDLDGDGVNEHAEIAVDADTDGDGKTDTVVIVNQYDTDGDGFADEVDRTYGVDTDGDGEIDASHFVAGTITNTPTDTDGDGRADTMVQTVTWDESTQQAAGDGSVHGDTADSVEAENSAQMITANVEGETYELDATHDVDGDGQDDTAVMQTSDGNYLVVADADEDGVADAAVLTDAGGQVIETAYVDPATGEWVEGPATGGH